MSRPRLRGIFACLVLILIGGAITWYMSFQNDLHLKEIDQLIKQKQFSEAANKAIDSFDLDSSNCRSLVLEPIEAEDSGGEEVVARTHFDQVVRLDPNRDSFHSSKRLVLTLFHEFVHCNQHQKLFEYFRSNHKQLSAKLKTFPLLKSVPLSGEAITQLSPSKLSASEVQEIEESLAQVLSPLARYLENAFEIDALVQVFQMKNLMPVNSEEFLFHIAYLKAVVAREEQRRKTQGEKTCRYSDDLVDEVAAQYEVSCLTALKLLKQHELF